MTCHRSICCRLLSKWKHRSTSCSYQQLISSSYLVLAPKKPPTTCQTSHLIVFHNKESSLHRLTVSSPKKSKHLVPVLAGNERRVFWLERHILEHWLFQYLLENNCVYSEWDRLQDEWNGKDTDFWCGTRGRKSQSVRPISFQCDALLFEFFLWLVENDDPSLRDLNLNDLMEFYDAET